jgi:Fe-S oxidoreductase
MVGFHPDRTMPKLAKQTLLSWYKKHNNSKDAESKGNSNSPLGPACPVGRVRGLVYLFCDEFTNYNDAAIGKKAILLLERLGYEVIIPNHIESGRTYLSKGLVKKAKLIANRNIELLAELITPQTPLLGIEPSGILTFRDEYIDLAIPENRMKAKEMAKAAFTLEEFLAKQFESGSIDRNLFTTEARDIHIHGHCYQKALSSQQFSKICMEIPVNYKANIIPSGCCGMAGGFGYEKEHYAIAQQVGELVLFPSVRAASENDIVVAAGTSCRHQIKDGTHKKALHPVEVLYDAMLK